MVCSTWRHVAVTLSNGHKLANYAEHKNLGEINSRPVNKGKLDEFSKRVKHC